MIYLESLLRLEMINQLRKSYGLNIPCQNEWDNNDQRKVNQRLISYFSESRKNTVTFRRIDDRVVCLSRTNH